MKSGVRLITQANERDENMDTPIFDTLRDTQNFMCQTCTDNGWPFGWFTCEGENLLCD